MYTASPPAHTAGLFPGSSHQLQSPRDDQQLGLVGGSPAGRHTLIKLPNLALGLFDSSSQGPRPPCRMQSPGPGMQVASSPCVHHSSQILACLVSPHQLGCPAAALVRVATTRLTRYLPAGMRQHRPVTSARSCLLCASGGGRG